MSSTKEKKRDARKKRSAAAARGDEDAKKKMKNDADRKKELRRIRAECAKPDWPGFPDRDASLGPALTDKEKAAQQAARDSIAKEKARKKKRVRTNERAIAKEEARERDLLLAKSRGFDALLEVQRDFIKILEKQEMCRVGGVLASEPERRLELSRDPDLAFGCHLPEDLALPQIGADLAWLHVLEIVLQTNLTPWSYDCDGGPRRKRSVFDLRELQSIPIRSIAYDREENHAIYKYCRDRRIKPKLLLPNPWAGYKLDATRPLTELGKTEIVHSRAPQCPEDQADGRTRELMRAFREKALDPWRRRAVSWRCRKCWGRYRKKVPRALQVRRDRDQVNKMEAHACQYNRLIGHNAQLKLSFVRRCGEPRDKVENEFLPETPKTPRPRAYIDLSIDDKPTGRIVFELFDDKAPKTVERFLKHCKSLRGLREVRNPFPDTYPWDSIGEDPAGGQGGDFDGGDDDDYTWRGWSFGYDTSHTDFSTRFQEEEEDEAKFTIYEPFIREGTLYFRYPPNPRCLNRPTGFYILQGTRPLNAGAFGRDVPFGRVLNYDGFGFEAEPDPPKGMKNAFWTEIAIPIPPIVTYPVVNVKIIACGRLEDADDSISRMAYLAALPPHVLRALGPIEHPVYKFLEPYGDDWERALAAVAGRSEACAARVAELSPDDYSGLFHALDTELESELL